MSQTGGVRERFSCLYNNLSYMRAIKLGGQKEKLYLETNLYEIELALKTAGSVGLGD